MHMALVLRRKEPTSPTTTCSFTRLGQMSHVENEQSNDWND